MPSGINQLLPVRAVSDITYWKLNETQIYISFHIDAYSHKITIYHIQQTLHAIESIQALKMALSDLKHESRIRPIHLAIEESNITAMAM